MNTISKNAKDKNVGDLMQIQAKRSPLLNRGNMSTIAEKKFRISSVIENLSPSGLVSGDVEKTEITPECFMKTDGAEYTVTYSEKTEGGVVFSDITIGENSVRVVRRGAIESDMLFEEGLLHKSLYRVAPYSFDVEVTTSKIRNNLTRDGGSVQIFYKMKIGGADKSVRMKIECL